MPASLQEFTAPLVSSWSDAELSVAVQAYLRMLHAELAGEYYNKAEVNRQLRDGALSERTVGSIEFRMRNISAALYDLKMPVILGYLPAANIGISVKEKIIAVLRANGLDSLAAFVPPSEKNFLAGKVSTLRKRRLGEMPRGNITPPNIISTTTTYVRDAAVKAWVLQAAKGTCEGCSHAAPFVGQDGLPYLEVHHITPLSSRGSDRISNAVALCPNCHRRCHFSSDRDEFRLDLYQRIPRLILEVSEPPDPGLDDRHRRQS
jgi:5-methylcytosine-specific restriction protein A